MSEELSKNGKKTGHFQTVTLANGSSCECEEVLIHIELIINQVRLKD